MIKKIFNYLLLNYKNQPLEIKKKSELLLYSLIGVFFVTLLVVFLELFLKFPFIKIIPFIFGILSIVIVLILLKC